MNKLFPVGGLSENGGRLREFSDFLFSICVHVV